MRRRGARRGRHPSTTGWPPRRLPTRSRTCWPAHTWRAGRWGPGSRCRGRGRTGVSGEPRGLRRPPRSPRWPTLDWGELYYVEVKLVAAKSEFAAALAAMPANADVQAALGDLALREGDAAAALAAYDLAVGLLPDYALQSAGAARPRWPSPCPRGAAWPWCGWTRLRKAETRHRRRRLPSTRRSRRAGRCWPARRSGRPRTLRWPTPTSRWDAAQGDAEAADAGVCGRHPVRPFPGSAAPAGGGERGAAARGTIRPGGTLESEMQREPIENQTTQEPNTQRSPRHGMHGFLCEGLCPPCLCG